MRFQPRTLLLAGCAALAWNALVWTGGAAAAEPATGAADVDGVTLAYVDEGTGEPVVFVHGAVSDLRTWGPIRTAIADDHRFIAFTQRYFGTAEWPDAGGRFSVATHADDLIAFVRALDVAPATLVGWSYGANVATAAALKAPGIVRGVVLFEPALSSLVKEGAAGDAARKAEQEMFGPVTAAVEDGDEEAATRRLIEGVFQMPPGGFDRQPEDLRTIQLDNARTMPLLWSAPPWAVSCDMLTAFDKPTLLVHGADSNAYWPHVVQAMADCLPQAEVAVLPGVNHDGPIRDPAGFARMIEAFMATH